MCGICGISQEGPVSREVLETAVEALAHRGPDSSGVFLTSVGRIGLGHTRLAILDLSEAGHQPMIDKHTGVTISFNGEIYNFRELRDDLSANGYQFRSDSDTEVLLAGYLTWGEDLLSRLNGIFAFAIYDPRHNHLFLARDPLGVKPLYYVQNDKGFAFASEIKALTCLLPFDRSLDYAAISRYVAFLWSPGDKTPFKAVRKLAPATALIVRDGRIERQWTYWNPKEYEPRRDWAVEDCAAELRSLVDECVRRQMISDAPVGAFLSGGLDSSTLVAAARRDNPNIECFSIDPQGGAGQGVTDDLPYARRVASHLDVKLHEIVVSSQSMCDHIEHMVSMLDEPLADPACLNVYFISKLAADHGIKVLLSGAGGDDLFTGYRRHQALVLEPFWNMSPAILRQFLATLTRYGNKQRTLSRQLARLFQIGALESDERLIASFIWNSRDGVMDLLSPEVANAVSTEPLSEPLEKALAGIQHLPAVEKCLMLEKRFFLADHNLIYTDKMAMAASVEVRVPLIDVDLVDFAARVPVNWKQRGVTTKWILKESQRGVLPSDVIDRPKAGFGAPLRRWLSNGMHDLVNELLSPDVLRNRGLFNPKAVSALIKATSTGRIDGSYTLFSLMCIELWCKHFLDADIHAMQQSDLFGD